jgi:hypothetical protein
MKKEREEHEALSLLFHRVVLNVMVMDGAKAQIEGEFRRNLEFSKYDNKVIKY